MGKKNNDTTNSLILFKNFHFIYIIITLIKIVDLLLTYISKNLLFVIISGNKNENFLKRNNVKDTLKLLFYGLLILF